MKIRISDKELVLQNNQEADCRMLIASGSSPFPEIGSVGTTWPQTLKRSGFPINPLAWDFAVIAAGVVSADQTVQRSLSPDGWTRIIELEVDVLNPQIWSHVAPLLTKALGFLTGDHWQLNFIKGLAVLPNPEKPEPLVHDCVSLLSGGLDSLIGAIDLKAKGLRPFFVSQTARGDSEKQVRYARTISGDDQSHFQFGETVHLPKGMRADTSHRSRSILFLAMGVVAACGTKKYSELKKNHKVPLVVPENGFISVNVPLTPTRLGSHSTKTTHPYFMGMIQAALDGVGLSVELTNPYQWKTKAEMIKECSNKKLLDKLIFSSTSCGRFARTYTHCGRCVPCIIRRAAINASYRNDKTEYRFEDLGLDDRNHAKFSDVLGVKMAISRARKVGVEKWAGSSISTVLIPDVPACVSMLDKSIAELGKFSKRSTRVFDFHCHLDIYPPSEQFLTHVKTAEFVFAVTTTPLALEGNKSRFGQFHGIKIGCGLHPELVASRRGELPLLLDLIGSEVFVGEVGLDGSPAHRRSLANQIEVFTSVVRRCGEIGGKVVSIHSRNAVGPILDILESNRSVGYPIFHWFTGTPNQALRAVKLGSYFSVNSKAVLSRTGNQWIGVVPRHRILTETDGPFCDDGSRPLWPGETTGTIVALSEIWKISYDEAFQQICDNTRSFLREVT